LSEQTKLAIEIARAMDYPNKIFKITPQEGSVNGQWLKQHALNKAHHLMSFVLSVQNSKKAKNMEHMENKLI